MQISPKMFLSDKQGMSAIEFAIVLPVASLILMGIVEFGVAGLKGQSLQRSLASAASSVQANPQDVTNFQLANSNTSLIDYGSDGNFICANAYETLEEAQNGSCEDGLFVTTLQDASITSYYVFMKGQVANAAITGLMAPFIGNISDTQVIGVNAGGATVASNDRCPDPSSPLTNGFYGVQGNIGAFYLENAVGGQLNSQDVVGLHQSGQMEGHACMVGNRTPQSQGYATGFVVCAGGKYGCAINSDWSYPQGGDQGD